MLKLKKMTKVERNYFIKHITEIVVGTILLAFGTAIFLVNLNIVTGGISGVGIIIQENFHTDLFGGQIIDIVSFVITWVLWAVGLIFVGKDFAFKTLLSSIIYPFALSLFLRAPIFVTLSQQISFYGCSEETMQQIMAGTASAPIGNLLVCAIFAGGFIGTGIALNFKGGGSTGGFDVFIALLWKYLRIKESISSIIIDGVVIFLGAILIKNNIVPSLCGIICAVVTAIMIEYFYVGKQTSLQADIISDKWEEISEFVQSELLRGATIIEAKGGYKQDGRVVLRVVFDKTQYKAIREFIGKVDPTAFMTFTQTFGVYGEGFTKNENALIKKNKAKKAKKEINGK